MNQLPEESNVDLGVPDLRGTVAQPRGGWTLRDEFAAMARRMPGGFGGLYLDDGVLTIVLAQPERANAARAALEHEAFIQSRRAGLAGERFAPGTARVHPARYGYDDLYEWYNQVLTELEFVLFRSSIDVRRNLIKLGIANEAQRIAVERAVVAAGVPIEAVMITVAPEVHLAGSLVSRVRPVPGGVQVEWDDNGPIPCTIGPSVIRLGQPAFLVNAHCTKNIGVIDNTTYWQHEVDPWYSAHHWIGQEAMDPQAFPCIENSVFGCRNADIALGLYGTINGDTVDYAVGKIARTVGENSFDLDIDMSNPEFTITQTRDWSVVGDTLHKVGRTTGWTSGVVTDGCVAISIKDPQGNVAGPTIRCSMIVGGVSGGGDSGSPVFRILSGSNVELRGVLWGTAGTYGLSCSAYLANNLGGIEMDLDPNMNAPLQYIPNEDGGGGGGDGPGDPPHQEYAAPRGG